VCSSAGEAVIGLRYRRRAGPGGSGRGKGRRSSVKGGYIGRRERVRYSSRETAGALKLEKERAAERSRAERFDLNPDCRLVVDGESEAASPVSMAKEESSESSVGGSGSSGCSREHGSISNEQKSFDFLSIPPRDPETVVGVEILLAEVEDP